MPDFYPLMEKNHTLQKQKGKSWKCRPQKQEEKELRTDKFIEDGLQN